MHSGQSQLYHSLSISTKGWINLSGTCSTYTWSIINPSGLAWPCPWVPGATRQQYIHNEAPDRYNTPALRSVLCVRVIKPSALPRHASQPARRGVRDAYRWNVLQVFAAGHHRGQIPCWPLHASDRLIIRECAVRYRADPSTELRSHLGTIT